MILYYFKRAFPLKTVYVSELNRNRLHGIRISSKRMRLLSRLKKKKKKKKKNYKSYRGDTRLYYQISSNIQNSSKWSQKRQNYRYVLRAKNETKTTWQINKDAGISLQYVSKSLSNWTEITSNLQNVTDMLNSCFVGIIDELLNQNSSRVKDQLSLQRINCCPNTKFIFPVTENEVVCNWMYNRQILSRFWWNSTIHT